MFVTQFLGALNDNVLRNALIVLLTFQAASWTTLKPEMLANLVTGIFILPLFLFSATAGQLADKFDKARLTRILKLNKIGIVLVAGAGFGMHKLELLKGNRKGQHSIRVNDQWTICFKWLDSAVFDVEIVNYH